MGNEIINSNQHPKVVIDYKNNAINALVSAIIGIGLTSIAEYFRSRAERKREKIEKLIADIPTTDKK